MSLTVLEYRCNCGSSFAGTDMDGFLEHKKWCAVRENIEPELPALTPPAEGDGTDTLISDLRGYADAHSSHDHPHLKMTLTLAADLLSRLSAEVARVKNDLDLARMESTRLEMLARDLNQGRDSEIERLQHNLNLFRDKHKLQMDRANEAERARDEAVKALSDARANGLLEAADMCSRFEDCGPSFIAQRLRDSAAALSTIQAPKPEKDKS